MSLQDDIFEVEHALEGKSEAENFEGGNQKIYKWPEGYIECAVPWYLILRRVLFVPLVAIGIVLVYTSLLFGWGKEEADRFKENSL